MRQKNFKRSLINICHCFEGQHAKLYISPPNIADTVINKKSKYACNIPSCTLIIRCTFLGHHMKDDVNQGMKLQ